MHLAAGCWFPRGKGGWPGKTVRNSTFLAQNKTPPRVSILLKTKNKFGINHNRKGTVSSMTIIIRLIRVPTFLLTNYMAGTSDFTSQKLHFLICRRREWEMGWVVIPVLENHGKDWLTGGHLVNVFGQEFISSKCALGWVQTGRDFTQIWDLRRQRVVCGNF